MHTIALKNGAVLAWGNNDFGQCNIPAAAQSGVSAIAGGEQHTIALKPPASVPTISSVSPTSGPINGGTEITISGTNFTGATSVTVNGVAATSVVVVSATSITARTPAGTAGAKSVAVTTAGGTVTKANAFTYVAAAVPTISTVSPTSGPTSGGTAITITGTNLTGATSVTVNGVAATNVLVVSATSITIKTPAGTAGAKIVAVTTVGGTVTKTGGFTYVATTPIISDVTPTSGLSSGGTAITIFGTNFTGATRVTVGGASATSVVLVNDTSITATTPAGAIGAKDVAVTTNVGTATKNGAFTYIILVPTISAVIPYEGSILGGNAITITGTNLTGASIVKIGGVATTNVVVLSPTTITAKTPAGILGIQPMVITTPGGTATKTDAFNYVQPPPTITSVAPTFGSTSGGTSITITGTNLTGASIVKIGGVGVEAKDFVVVSATSITVKTPAGTAGKKDVTVKTRGGTATKSSAFTYIVPDPTITSVSPPSGPITGGTTITITGTNLTGATRVAVGGIAATSFVVVSATSITATTSAGTAGNKDVTVTTAGGIVTKTNAFTYIAPVPNITSVSPPGGVTDGGTRITITGTNLTGATSVKIDVTSATNVVVVSATSITAQTPAGTVGAKDVVVTTPGGTATKSSAFTYYTRFDGGNTPGAAGSESGNCDVIASGNGNDANTNASNNRDNVSGSGANTSTAKGTTTSDIEAAAPMGVELYLQTVALRADAQVACDDAAGVRNESASEFVGPLVNEQASASDHAVNGTSVPKIADADTVADIAEAIDLDHNGVADMCQLRGGDFDLNGVIDDRDMSIILNMINTEPIMGIGDMDANGEIDSADISVILLRMN